MASRAAGRHRATRKRRRARQVAVAAVAAVAVTALATGSTTAQFADSARAALGVRAASEFPCMSEVTAPFEFAQAPVEHGSGTWTRTSALCSPDRRWVAVFQTDGNFVLYDTSTTPGTAIWATQTYTTVWATQPSPAGPGAHLVFEGDGNLVVSNAAYAALRSTRTSGIAQPARLVLQDDANLVIYDAGGTARWWSWGTQTTNCRTPDIFTCNPSNPGWGA